MVREWVRMLAVVGVGCSLLVGAAPDFYEWMNTSMSTLWGRELLSWLDARVWVTIPICVVATYLTFLLIKRVYEDEDVRPFRVGIAFFLTVVLGVSGEEFDVQIIDGITFLDYFKVLLLGYWVALIYVVFREASIKIEVKADSEKIKTRGIGFSGDSIQEESISRHVIKYADAVAKQLIDTAANNKHSFAVGITGEWGSGKTTFLNLLKNNLQNHAEVVEFNPWMCLSPDQLTRDFFSSMRNQLSRKHSRLAKPISHYAKYLGKVRASFFTDIWVDGLSFINAPSLFKMKSELSEKFARLERPVVVFIDDLDRLESKEIFEVLRLIRNTGDIKNVIYIAAFDKGYVLGALASHKCAESNSYLEKIFPVELHLPKPESYQLWRVFEEQISRQSRAGKRFANRLSQELTDEHKGLIIGILSSYRKVKSFSRTLMLNFRFIAENYPKEFRLLDFLWIELLQFYDKQTYDSLAENTNIFLYYDNQNKRYCLRNGIHDSLDKQDDSKNYKGSITWQPLTPKILNILFGAYRKSSALGIVNAENYMKYFAIGLTAQKLSVNEMYALLDGKNEHKTIVDSWISAGKHISSIEYQLLNINIASLQGEALSNLIEGALYFGLKKQSWRNNSIQFLRTVLRKRGNSNEDAIKEIAVKWLEHSIENDDDFVELSSLLNALYVSKYNEIDDISGNIIDAGDYPLIIENANIEKLLSRLIETYLNKFKSEVSVVDILIPDTTLYKIFHNCCVEIEFSGYEGEGSYRQTGFEALIKHFSKSDEKPDIKEYNERISMLFYEPEPDRNSFESDDAYEDYCEHWREDYFRRMCHYFGDKYDEKLVKLQQECFITRGKDKESAKSDNSSKKTVIQASKNKKKRSKKGFSRKG